MAKNVSSRVNRCISYYQHSWYNLFKENLIRQRPYEVENIRVYVDCTARIGVKNNHAHILAGESVDLIMIDDGGYDADSYYGYMAYVVHYIRLPEGTPEARQIKEKIHQFLHDDDDGEESTEELDAVLLGLREEALISLNCIWEELYYGEEISHEELSL